ncbi:F-box protein At5g62510-like [Ipomoea triloba]|uniref:F-box protein At5g62510-like n=1 Tax=Ipomoea triloba TaxID=35885 RepID=UPI00125D3898|nr:F-box protein At5g62510-like [Ipomoea triloba]
MEDERQMEASSASISCITCLPREILVKILSGLPAKCAVRFRCTCKFFYCYIPEPRFSFTIRFVLPTNNAYPASRLYSVSYTEDDDSVQKLDARGLVWSNGSSCAPDGKMCLLRNQVMGLIGALFDLSTGRCIYLPPNYPAMYFGISNSNIIGNGDFVLTRNSSIGKCPIAVLGFDSISERYKVFASEVSYNGERVLWKQHWVLTLGVDESWREIRSTIFIGLTDAAVHIYGIIYFIPQVTKRESSLKMIVAMDVARERIMRFTPFPSGYHQSRQRVRGWVPWIKLNGRLAFIDIIIPESEDPHPHPDLAESKIEIWTLKIRSVVEEEWERSVVEEEWEKQTVLLPLEESEVIGRATSMGFTSNSMGEIVILLRSKTTISPLILIYSFRRDLWRRIEISGVSKYSSSSYISDMEVVVHVDDEIVASFENE